LSNAYLDVLTITEVEKLYQENISRTKLNLATSKTLVANGLKPGSDTALFAAELSKATIELLTIRKSKEQAIILLQQLSATDAAFVIADSSFFYKLPSNAIVSDTSVHPLLSLYQATIELDKAKKKTISKTSSPTLGVWGTGYARGSDVQYDGSIKTLDGLGLQRINYGVGVQLSMPLLQSAKIKPQLKQQDFQVLADEEKKKELSLQLSGQTKTAESSLALSIEIAKEGKGLVNSADFAYNALLSRYSAGLANYTDLIQAQYNLVKAKIDIKTNYMAVWKSLLYKAAVTGNLNLFLQQVK
jgi:outer membrane protein